MKLNINAQVPELSDYNQEIYRTAIALYRRESKLVNAYKTLLKAIDQHKESHVAFLNAISQRKNG